MRRCADLSQRAYGASLLPPVEAQAAAEVLAGRPYCLEALVVPNFAGNFADVDNGAPFMYAVHKAIQEGLVMPDFGNPRTLFKETQAYLWMHELDLMLPAVPLGVGRSLHCVAVLQKKKYDTVRSTHYRFKREAVKAVDAWLEKGHHGHDAEDLRSFDSLSCEAYEVYLADRNASHPMHHSECKITLRLYQALARNWLQRRFLSPPASSGELQALIDEFKTKIATLKPVLKEQVGEYKVELENQPTNASEAGLFDKHEDGQKLVDRIEHLESCRSAGVDELAACLFRLYEKHFKNPDSKNKMRRDIEKSWT